MNIKMTECLLLFFSRQLVGLPYRLSPYNCTHWSHNVLLTIFHLFMIEIVKSKACQLKHLNFFFALKQLSSILLH